MCWGFAGRTTGSQEERIAQFDEREAPHIAQVYDMGYDSEAGEEKGEAVDDAEEQLQGHDGVYQAREEALGDDGVLLNELG